MKIWAESQAPQERSVWLFADSPLRCRTVLACCHHCIQLWPVPRSFEKGQRDEFIQESVDVGTIQKLQIGEPHSHGLTPEPGPSHEHTPCKVTLWMYQRCNK